MGKTTKHDQSRFKIYSFNEILDMGHDKWVETCRQNGCDMEDHPEDVAIEKEMERRRR